MYHLRRRSRSRGQGLVEFALVLPIFLVILIGMVDLGRTIWANNSVANASREAARFAAVHGGSCEDLSSTGCGASNYCPVGPAVSTAAIPATSSSCPFPSSSKQSIYNTATGYLVGGGTTTVTACYYDPTSASSCTGNTDQTTYGTNKRGNAVTVTVSTTVPIILGSFLGFSTLTVSGTSTMLINH